MHNYLLIILITNIPINDVDVLKMEGGLQFGIVYSYFHSKTILRKIVLVSNLFLKSTWT
jgi:hypothetical protein